MALGDPYATPADLKARIDLKPSDTADDARMTEVLASVSREIEAYTRRQFNAATAPTARLFHPDAVGHAVVDDFSTTTGLVIATDAGNDGTYEQVWNPGDYQLEPLNGIVAGQSGWPYDRILAVGSRWFPMWVPRRFPGASRRPSLQVTAQWGWAAVPAAVKESCLILAAETFKLSDAPFGVAGYGEYGPVRVRMNSRAQTLLAPYRRMPVLVG